MQICRRQKKTVCLKNGILRPFCTGRMVVPVKKILVVVTLLLVVFALFWAFQKKLPETKIGTTNAVPADEQDVLVPYQTPTPEGPIPYSQIIEEKEKTW